MLPILTVCTWALRGGVWTLCLGYCYWTLGLSMDFLGLHFCWWFWICVPTVLQNWYDWLFCYLDNQLCWCFSRSFASSLLLLNAHIRFSSLLFMLADITCLLLLCDQHPRDRVCRNRHRFRVLLRRRHHHQAQGVPVPRWPDLFWHVDPSTWNCMLGFFSSFWCACH